MSDSALVAGRTLDGRAASAEANRRAWFSVLLAVALLVLRWPYRGVRHDAILYLGQALMHQDPSWGRADIYFAYGSQDQYSVFSPLLAAAISWLGVERAEIALLVPAAALALWAILLLARYLPEPARWFGPVVLVGTTHYYGSHRIFSFLEPFLTARSWAEPLSLIALVLLLRGRLAWALLAWLAAAACHPLVAIPVALVGWVWLILQDRRWSWGALAAVPIIGLAMAGVRPFSSLLVCYDDIWFHVTVVANESVFLSLWSPAELVIAAGTSVLLWWAGRSLARPLADLCRATAIAVVALCVVSFVGADFWHDVLITQLQLWRVLWIASLLAMLVLPHLVAILLKGGAPGRLAAASLVLAVLARDFAPSNAWALVLWAILAIAAARRGYLDKSKPRVLNLATAGLVAAAVLMSFTQAVTVWSELRVHTQGMAIGREMWTPVTVPLFAVCAAAGLWWLHQAGGWQRRVAVGALAAMMLVGVAGWDQRSPWQRYIERTPPGTHPFDALVPAGAQVVWDRDLLPAWLLLKRPSYFASGQVSGVLFNRGNAMAVVERLPRAQPFIRGETQCMNLERMGYRESQVQECAFPRAAFLDLCAIHGPGRPADFLVAPVDVGVEPVARWQFTPDDGEAPTTWRLYDCRRLPEGAATAQSVTRSPS